MEKRYYDPCQHRPEPDILIGFSKEDCNKILKSIQEAKEYMLKRRIGIDGLTDEDRILIEQAKRTIYDFRVVIKMFKEAETIKAKSIIKKEIARIYNNTEIQKRIQRSE